jgi:hydroxymethylglutaryl-CoA lyase
MAIATVKIVECPRDAWQGLPRVIPTQEKASYLRKLIELGFRHLDAVSFVAPKYVPQMADSEMVLQQLGRAGVMAAGVGTDSGTVTSSASKPPLPASASGIAECEIIGIVVNEQGLQRALAAPGVTTIGYPYSLSANFRRANANMSLSESRDFTGKLCQACKQHDRDLVVYVSMAFGNHYGEPWSPEVTAEAVAWLKQIGVRTASLADTIGSATAKQVEELFRSTKTEDMELGIHLHSRAEDAGEKVLAGYEAGCRRFDCALTGLGGCPFARDDLVGNVPTEIAVSVLNARGAQTGIESGALLAAVEATNELRNQYAHL